MGKTSAYALGAAAVVLGLGPSPIPEAALGAPVLVTPPMRPALEPERPTSTSSSSGGGGGGAFFSAPRAHLHTRVCVQASFRECTRASDMLLAHARAQAGCHEPEMLELPDLDAFTMLPAEE
ncbi:hypothetical protein EON67_04785 [archaeon]|nr:MAG: hypothetical protein EON67_04785 [archaeon]